jgi:hypothetical protein
MADKNIAAFKNHAYVLISPENITVLQNFEFNLLSVTVSKDGIEDSN